MIPWWLASLLSNVAIISTEYLNRHGGDGTWTSVLPYTAPLIFVAQWGLFVTWNGAPHLLAAWAVFTIGNTVMRLAMVHFFGEGFSWLAFVGVSVMVGGAFLVKQGLSYGG